MKVSIDFQATDITRPDGHLRPAAPSTCPVVRRVFWAARSILAVAGWFLWSDERAHLFGMPHPHHKGTVAGVTLSATSPA